MHNHFHCICSLCAFSLRKRFLHISRSALLLLLFIIQKTNKQNSFFCAKNASWILKPLRRGMPFIAVRCFWKLFSIHHPFKQHSAMSGESDWLQFKMESTHKQQFWWQPPPPEVLTSERISVRTSAIRFPSLLFLRCARILCFQWPVLCSTAKTSHGRLHRKSITSPLFHCFTALGRLL